MAHTHENCPDCGPLPGVLMGLCGPDCPSDGDCVVVGHCICNCHSNKTCYCGHTWPRMYKKEKA